MITHRYPPTVHMRVPSESHSSTSATQEGGYNQHCTTVPFSERPQANVHVVTTEISTTEPGMLITQDLNKHASSYREESG